MILEEIRIDEPFPLALRLHPRLTVITGLGPKRRAWLAAAVADAMAGRDTTLWGVVQVVGLRVDLGDRLVVRAATGIDSTIGPELWRSDSYGPEWAQDDLWPSSSLPDASHERVAAARLGLGVATEPPPPDPAAGAEPPSPPPPPRRRRWRRAGRAPAPQELAPAAAQVDGRAGNDSGPPLPEHPLQLAHGEPHVVPPSVIVPDPPRPPILDEPGPPLPGPMTIPPRPVVRAPEGSDQVPAPPRRSPALDAPPPPDPGTRPVPPDVPAPPPPPVPPSVDPPLERKVAELAQELADRRAHAVRRRAAAAAAVVPVAGDVGPVAAALAEVEERRAAEVEALAGARRLAARWQAAEEEADQARTWRVPAWLRESAQRSLDHARQELAEAEADADAEQPLDMALVDRLEAGHREVGLLEARRSSAGNRRRLQAARDEESALLRELGLRAYTSPGLRLDLNRGTAEPAARRERAAAAVAEAEAVWAQLHAPRDDSAAAAAAARLAEVWAQVAAFLGQRPHDVLAALAARPAAPAVAAAEAGLAAALQANGIDPPSSAEELVRTAGAWLAAAEKRVAAVAAAEAEARRAADAARRAEEAVGATAERHAEAAAALTAASAAAAVRCSAAEVAHRQATARWREEVAAADAAHAATVERWEAAVAGRQRWAMTRREAETAYEGQMAEHRAAVAALARNRRVALDAAQQQADAAWEATVAALQEEHDARRARRAAWERRRQEAEAAWQGQLDSAAVERRRLEEERAEGLAALAAWGERHVPAPELPELQSMLLQRVAASTTAAHGGGAVPLIVDDALSSLPVDVAAALFGLFVQVSSNVQVVYLTDDPATLAIARSLDGISVVEVDVAT